MKTTFNIGDTIFNKTLETNIEAIMINELSDIESWEIISIFNPQADFDNKFNDGFSDDDEDQYILKNTVTGEILQVRANEIDTDFLSIEETDEILNSNKTYYEDIEDYQDAVFSN